MGTILNLVHRKLWDQWLPKNRDSFFLCICFAKLLQNVENSANWPMHPFIMATPGLEGCSILALLAVIKSQITEKGDLHFRSVLCGVRGTPGRVEGE